MKKFSQINESLWGNIRDRVNKETVRDEDNIDHLDPEEFCKYLWDIYDDGTNKGFGYEDVHISKYGIMKAFSPRFVEITIPFAAVDSQYEYKGKWMDFKNILRLNLEIDKKTYEYEPIKITDDKNIEKILTENGYVFERRLPPDSSRVYPKNGKITNQTVLNILDLLLKDVEEPMLKKK